MAGETEVRMMLEAEEKSLKALIALLKLIGNFGGKLGDLAIDLGVKGYDYHKENKIGEVNRKNLMSVAKKQGQNIMVQDGIPRKDIPQIMALAKEHGIQVAVLNPKSENVNARLAFKQSDKEIFEQIIKGIVQEKIKARPDDLNSFAIKEWEVKGLLSELKKNNVAVNVVKDKGGNFHCVYENVDKQAVELSHNSFKQKHAEILSDFQVKEQDGFYILQDTKLGKQISMNGILEMGENELAKKLTEHFGYDETKAELAVGKFAENLSPEKQAEFFADTPDKSINSANMIHLENENPLLAEYSYFQVNLKEDGTDRFIIMDKDGKTAFLTEDIERNKEMLSHIGITNEQKVNAILEKHAAVAEVYAQKALNLTTVDVGGKGTIHLERTDTDNFKVEIGEMTKSFSFSDKQKAVSIISLNLMSRFNVSEKEAVSYAKTAVSNAENMSIYKIAPEMQKTNTPEYVIKPDVHGNFNVTFGEISKDFKIGNKDETINAIGKEFNIPVEKATQIYEKAENASHFEINRKDVNTFAVDFGITSKEYSLSNKEDVIVQIQNDFEVSEDTATAIFDKASEQNLIEENIGFDNSFDNGFVPDNNIPMPEYEMPPMPDYDFPPPPDFFDERMEMGY